MSAGCDHLPTVLFSLEQQGMTHQWKKLGIYLNLLVKDLQVIEGDNARLDDRMISMLDLWLRSGRATKLVLEDAMRKIR